eukprot:CAMPEP_0194321338 /NCGR_PEP_ID=MMETSP0171-20130528/17552_1 /TAXON_ID=218684 /ORGANISM="Corethron pennatum, Strain L29A3" /LENGTH=211 /DNA_ID=CAMNT_0039079179 /DNA_START=367 /DNA_END=1002 /DNA_ORIENTATION=-
MLPASHRFVAPVSRTFRDLYDSAVDERRRNRTYKYSIISVRALELYMDEAKHCYDRKLEALHIGAGAGRIDWVKRAGVWDQLTCRAAAAGGQIRVMKWLRGRDCPWNWWASQAAAGGGHLEMLQWLRGEECPWGSWTCRAAAEGGHLEVLQWTVASGCPWDEWTCKAAADGGHLGVLRWAIENGCDYDEDNFKIITDPKFLEWFENHKTPS